jgi:hypothetical protein
VSEGEKIALNEKVAWMTRHLHSMRRASQARIDWEEGRKDRDARHREIFRKMGLIQEEQEK